MKGNYEKKVLTTKVWHMFLKNYEQAFTKFRGVCINATEGGAYIPGTRLMSLEKAKKKFLTEGMSPLEILKGNLHSLPSKEVEGVYEKLIATISGGIQDLASFVKQCQDWEEKIVAFLQNGERFQGDKNKLSLEYGRFITELTRAKEELTSHPSYVGIMIHIMQSFIIGKEIVINAVPPYHNPDPIKAKRGIIAEHIEWFQANAEVIGKTERILRRHLRRIKKTAETFKGRD